MSHHSVLRDSLEYWVAIVVLKSLEISPRTVAERLARLYTRVLDLAVPRLRRVALRNLGMALPDFSAEERNRIAEGVFRSIARLLVAFARFPKIHRNNVSDWIRYEGYEYFEQANQAEYRVPRQIITFVGDSSNWTTTSMWSPTGQSASHSS